MSFKPTWPPSSLLGYFFQGECLGSSLIRIFNLTLSRDTCLSIKLKHRIESRKLIAHKDPAWKLVCNNYFQSGDWKTFSVHPAVNDYQTFFRTCEDLGSEDRSDGWHSSHSMLIKISRALKSTAPTTNLLWNFL